MIYKPNFIVPGFCRTGTTFLYEMLRYHEDVFLPEKKEIHYFDRDYSRGPEYYFNYFLEADNKKVIGDITPTYIYEMHNAERIYDLLGGIKILIQIRNPVTRLLSQYKKNKREKLINRSFEEYSETVLLSNRLYYYNIKNFIEIFGEDNVMITVYEEIMQDKIYYLKSILQFLDIENPSFIKKIESIINKPVNPTLQPKSKILHVIAHKTYKNLLNSRYGHKNSGLIKLRNVYTELFTKKNVETTVISDKTKKYIIDFYKSDLEKLSKYLKKDLLDIWKLNEE